MNWLIGENVPYEVIDILNQDIILYEKFDGIWGIRSVTFDETVNSNHCNILCKFASLPCKFSYFGW